MKNVMQNRNPAPARVLTTLLGFLLLPPFAMALAADLASLRADRAEIERVYHNHRLGQKPPFEQVLPPATLENLVRQDLSKEAALKRVYGVEITAGMLATEVQRINTTTRAPDILAEIRAALSNDASRFANAFAKPILVDRLLREKFDNDDALHAAKRRQVERTRDELLNARQNGADYAKLRALFKRNHSNAVTETAWHLSARPAETRSSVDESEIRKRFGPNAQIFSSPQAGGKDAKSYLQDLQGELQNVMRVQLRRSGDVSAVIETPGGFLLFVAKERTEAVLSVAGLFLAKISYEQWLDKQTGRQP